MGYFGFPFRLPSLIERVLQDRVKITVREKERHWRKCASYFSSSINSHFRGFPHGTEPSRNPQSYVELKIYKASRVFPSPRGEVSTGLTRLGVHSLSLKKWYNKMMRQKIYLLTQRK